MSSRYAKEFHRLKQSLEKKTNGQAFIKDWDPDNITSFIVEVSPQGGPYKQGKFLFQIIVPEVYPDVHPDVVCLTDIYHPNIDSEITDEHNICLNLFDEWNKSFGLEDCVQGLIFLLYNPNLSDPISSLFDGSEESHESFVSKVQASLRGESFDGISFAKNPGYESLDKLKENGAEAQTNEVESSKDDAAAKAKEDEGSKGDAAEAQRIEDHSVESNAAKSDGNVENGKKSEDDEIEADKSTENGEPKEDVSSKTEVTKEDGSIDNVAAVKVDIEERNGAMSADVPILNTEKEPESEKTPEVSQPDRPPPSPSLSSKDDKEDECSGSIHKFNIESDEETKQNDNEEDEEEEEDTEEKKNDPFWLSGISRYRDSDSPSDSSCCPPHADFLPYEEPEFSWTEQELNEEVPYMEALGCRFLYANQSESSHGDNYDSSVIDTDLDSGNFDFITDDEAEGDVIDLGTSRIIIRRLRRRGRRGREILVEEVETALVWPALRRSISRGLHFLQPFYRLLWPNLQFREVGLLWTLSVWLFAREKRRIRRVVR